MSKQDVLKAIDGTSEDQLVALIKAIYEAKKKKHCGGCHSSPCRCKRVTCGCCGCNPCCCKPVTCGCCGCDPCCCKPVTCGCCGCNPCCCKPVTCGCCGCNPCCCKPVTCGCCGCDPCCCKPVTCGCCHSNPCCCKPVTCMCCGCNPCCCDPCKPNIGDYLLELGKLNLCFYEQLWEVNRRFHKTIASSFCAPVKCAPKPKKCCSGCGKRPCRCGSKQSKDIQKTMCLEGHTGHKAVGCFKISNMSRTDREVSFLLGEFRGEGKTGQRFVPAFGFSLTDGEGEPIADRILKKGDTATVTVEIPLVGDFETPGNYNGNVVVKSNCTVHLHLCIKVEGPEATAPKKAPPTAKGKPAKGRPPKGKPPKG